MSATPKLLSGGNPQIPKGFGNAPVQAYIAAMPEWKQAVGRRLDEVVTRLVPDVRKAVKWNSPLYGAAGTDTWFLSFHVYTRYVKVTFFDGGALTPPPPQTSKYERVRYWHIHEDDEIGAAFEDWVRQARSLPGEKL